MAQINALFKVATSLWQLREAESCCTRKFFGLRGYINAWQVARAGIRSSVLTIGNLRRSSRKYHAYKKSRGKHRTALYRNNIAVRT